MTTILTILAYFVLLLGVSRWATRRRRSATGRTPMQGGNGATQASRPQDDNDTFFNAGRQSPWALVAFGMVGASISGVTFVSVPGMVLTSQMTYLQLCLGFIAGYVVVAAVLLPVYYRLGHSSIYAYLGHRLGRSSYLTGAWFFLASKLAGAALKFYVVCLIVQQFVLDALGVPFWMNVAAMTLLIWLYTRRGGIGTLVYTDVVQTTCLFAALLLIIYMVTRQMGLTPTEAVASIAGDDRSRIVDTGDWASPTNLWKQLVSGAFIVIVMTGLDQDMMQKNLTCRTLGEAQKDMYTYGVAFLPANLLFLALGVLLAQWFEGQGMALPTKGDALLTTFVSQSDSTTLLVLFTLGIVAASFSSADSALTSLTTCFCLDIRQRPRDERLRRRTHLAMCLVFALFIIAFRTLNSTSLIDAIYTLVGYTYGPLLGLFAFGLLTHLRPSHRLVPWACLASPLLCWGLSTAAERLWNYRFGYELLLLNGLLTFLLLCIKARKTANER